jgi:hypothetical protein
MEKEMKERRGWNIHKEEKVRLLLFGFVNIRIFLKQSLPHQQTAPCA